MTDPEPVVSVADLVRFFEALERAVAAGADIQLEDAIAFLAEHVAMGEISGSDQ